MDKKVINIIGAGLAGCECALALSKIAKNLNLNVSINLYEMRPKVQTGAHKTSKCAELVCSNSFKSLKPHSASGMLKHELALLDSPLLKCSLDCSVDAGCALAVDRDLFSQYVTQLIKDDNNINYIVDEIKSIKSASSGADACVIATGPLTSKDLSQDLVNITNSSNYFFYDAASPIVDAATIDKKIIFEQDRYACSSSASYLNSPMNKDQYLKFIDQLVNAKCVILHDFESKDLFQACQPIEQIAKSGIHSARFGPMKPVGIKYPNSDLRPYAVVQLRSENSYKTAYNIVGFQTNLTFSEQKRVFRLIPGLENAEFLRYGVMHKNTFVNAPKLLNNNLQMINDSLQNFTNCPIYIVGQLSGTEGYLEAIRSGYHGAISVMSQLICTDNIGLSNFTVFGALLDYATSDQTTNYQPMHVNFGLIHPLQQKIRNKTERYKQYAHRGDVCMNTYVKKLFNNSFLSEFDIKSGQKLQQNLRFLWDTIQD